MSYARWIRDQPLTLSAEEEQMLREQEIDEEEGPGTVLRDLDVLLSFIQEEGSIRVTDKLRLLPLRALPEINARMSRPLQLGLQRPVQKSFPHIHGLYLLARASGLTRVYEDARKPRLSVAEWEFNFTLEQIDPADPSVEAPVVLEEGGNRPEQYGAWVSW